MGMRTSELLGTISQALHDSWPEVLDHDVSLVKQTIQYFPVARNFEVERDALFPAIETHEIRRFVVDERTERTRVIASADAFDLDDPGSEVRKNHRAIRAGKYA